MSWLVLPLFFLVFQAPETQQAVPKNLDSLVDSLPDDEIRFNALTALRELNRMIYQQPDFHPAIRTRLEKALNDRDRQLRHCATWLLASLYEKSGIGEEEWPAAMFENLVDGLRSDEIRGGHLFSNASDFLGVLYKIKSKRPVTGLRELIAGRDAQARFAASILLAHYLGPSVEPEVSEILIAHLADDRQLFNQYAAVRALIELGPSNLKTLTERVAESRDLDWQQAALLHCAAACWGLEWEVSESMLQTWLEKSMPEKYSRGSPIAQAALLLTPAAVRLYEAPGAPGLLRRVHRLGPEFRDLEKRARWIAGWPRFWFLQVEKGSDPGREPPFAAAYALGFWCDCAPVCRKR